MTHTVCEHEITTSFSEKPQKWRSTAPLNWDKIGSNDSNLESFFKRTFGPSFIETHDDS